MNGILKLKSPLREESDSNLFGVSPEFHSLQVWVSHLEPELEEAGLERERLYREVRQRLEKVGISLPEPASWQKIPTFPCLGVLVHADRAQVVPPFYVFSVEVFFVQQLPLLGTPGAHSMRLAWAREAIGDVRCTSQGFDWSPLYQTVGTLVEQFAEESLGLKPVPQPPDLRVQ